MQSHRVQSLLGNFSRSTISNMKKIKDFFNRLRPRSDQELMMEYLSEANDTAQLEYMMKQWEQRKHPSRWPI